MTSMNNQNSEQGFISHLTKLLWVTFNLSIRDTLVLADYIILTYAVNDFSIQSTANLGEAIKHFYEKKIIIVDGKVYSLVFDDTSPDIAEP